MTVLQDNAFLEIVLDAGNYYHLLLGNILKKIPFLPENNPDSFPEEASDVLCNPDSFPEEASDVLCTDSLYC